jgi:glycosyltransferase involved in cell wall biosynthesis
MKINIVLGHAVPFPPTKGGGIENLYHLLSKEFVRKGHEVVIYSRYDEGLKRDEIDEFGRRHVRVDGYDWKSNNIQNALDSFKWCWKLKQYIEKADVTLFNTLFSFLLLDNKKKYGSLISTIHRTPNWKVKLYKNFDRVYGGSKAVIDLAKEVAPKQTNLMTVYNCMEIKDWGFSEKQQTDNLKFLYFGRFVRDKGVEQLIKGFEKSLIKFPNNKLVTLGPQDAKGGADEEFFKEMNYYIKSNNLADKVEFMKPIFDKQKLFEELNKADVICVPTITGETFSMAILEVMSIKKPVLVSDFPPMIEAVEHLKTGYVSKVANEDSLKEGIEYFSENKEKINSMGEAAYNKLINEFTVDKIVDTYLNDFEKMRKE